MPRFEINFLDDYTDESLLDEIRRVAAQSPGTSLSSDTFEQVSQRVSASTIRRRFGSWQIALTKAGLAHLYGGRKVSEKMKEQPAKRLTMDDLITDMQRVHALVGKGFLTVSDFNTHSISSVVALRRRFGTWANAPKEAGIAQSEMANKNWTDEDCFENLATLWTHYGRSPAYREMFLVPSTISGKEIGRA